MPGKTMKKASEPVLKVSKTRFVFWDLEYWHKLDTPHCLDQMHNCKNALESLLATLMNMPDKTKDGPGKKILARFENQGRSAHAAP